MLRPTTIPTVATASSRSNVATGIVGSAIVLGVALMLGASVMWMHYGTAIFFEMIASGIAACF